MRIAYLLLFSLVIYCLLPTEVANSWPARTRGRCASWRLPTRSPRCIRNRTNSCRPCCPAPQGTAGPSRLDSPAGVPVATEQQTTGSTKKLEGKAPGSDNEAWRDLFDGKTLSNWKSTKFGGEGEVYVEDGAIRLDFGQPMTGITYDGDALPKNNYEIQLEAQRVDGFDFFCGLTFPVDDSHCSLVVGGWGGSVVGISSIDDMDASENNTTSYIPFTNEKWYVIRVRVTPGLLEAWIDGKRVVDEDVSESKLSTRIEVDLSRPLGVASFDTQAAIRNIRLREL